MDQQQRLAALRRPPARPLLERVVEEIAPGATLGAVRRLKGGIGTRMFAIATRSPGGVTDRYVVRSYLDLWHDDHAARAERERRTLDAVAEAGLPVPVPVWADTDARVFDAPTIVTTFLRGRTVLRPPDVHAWLHRLAGALVMVQEVDATQPRFAFLPRRDDTRLADHLDQPPGEHGYEVESHPDGARVWAVLREHIGSLQPVPLVLQHGDFWAGNTMWHRGRLSGIVDWPNAGVGPSATEVAYCRMDLSLLFGRWAGDEFLAAYEATIGAPVPDLAFRDLLASLSAMPDPGEWEPGYTDLGVTDLSPQLVRTRLRRWIAAGLDRIRRA